MRHEANANETEKHHRPCGGFRNGGDFNTEGFYHTIKVARVGGATEFSDAGLEHEIVDHQFIREGIQPLIPQRGKGVHAYKVDLHPAEGSTVWLLGIGGWALT